MSAAPGAQPAPADGLTQDLVHAMPVLISARAGKSEERAHEGVRATHRGTPSHTHAEEQATVLGRKDHQGPQKPRGLEDVREVVGRPIVAAWEGNGRVVIGLLGESEARLAGARQLYVEGRASAVRALAVVVVRCRQGGLGGLLRAWAARHCGVSHQTASSPACACGRASSQ